uniref:Uncharacterized protein n=1 Tax=Arundo donax TaxID=35708 RepID=A0A0A9C2D3_ARUDO
MQASSLSLCRIRSEIQTAVCAVF